GVRRPACDPLGGFALYLAIAVPSAVLACALGVACGFVAPRRAGWVYAGVFAGSLVVALWPVVRGPQVFAFHHLGGMYPGPIYDEAITTSRALWLFRADTLLYAGACAGIALIAGPPRPRRRGMLALAACGLGAIWMSLQAEKLHWKAGVAQLDGELGGRIETEHLVLHFPREKKDEERALMARDAEIDVRAVAAFFGITPGPRIDVYLYRSADEKRTLIGAAETSFTKPWLRQIHTNDAPPPHPILRHELVHALGAQIAAGPWGVPGGIVPQMALIEGMAVAADWPAGARTRRDPGHPALCGAGNRAQALRSRGRGAAAAGAGREGSPARLRAVGAVCLARARRSRAARRATARPAGGEGSGGCRSDGGEGAGP